MTPKRADATCLIALRRRVPVGIGHESLFVLAALARVGLSADAVHGDRQGLVRFLADRAERHRAGGESLHDLGSRLDVVQRNRRAGRFQIEHAAQHQEIAVLLIHDVRELLESLETRLLHRVLELADRERVQQMAFAPHAVLIFAADAQLRVRVARQLHRELVLQDRLSRQHFDADALDPRSRSRKVAFHERTVQSDGLENLGALITLQRRDAHLRESLQKPLVDRLHVALENLVPRVLRRKPATHVEMFERLDGEIGVHRARAIAEEQCKVHHLARLAGLDDQSHLVARLLADQVVVNRGESEQAWNGRVRIVHASIRENQQRVAGLDRQRSAAA